MKAGSTQRSATEVKALIEQEVARIESPLLRQAAASVLVEPRLQPVPWDYGEDGEQFDCWIVANLRPWRPYVVAYCEQGFGPADPFGVIDADLSTMGMDARWWDSLGATLDNLGRDWLEAWAASR